MSFTDLQTRILEIDGHTTQLSLAIWDFLLSHQNTAGMKGDLVEIGVWRGRSASMLMTHARNEETTLLIDAAIDQPRLDQVRDAFNRGGQVEYLQAHSWDLAEHAALVQRRNKTRWMHIDGEHSGDAVLNDLDLAHQLMRYDGIVVLDDFFSEYYPQITRAVFNYVDANPHKFDLFMMADYKAYLARPRFANTYRRLCLQAAGAELASRGHPVTLIKSTHSRDLDCITIAPFNGASGAWRGPDWRLESIEVNVAVKGPSDVR